MGKKGESLINSGYKVAADFPKSDLLDNFDDIKKKMEELNTVAQKIGAAMYQSASASAEASAGKQGGQAGQPGAEAGTQPGVGPDQDKKDQGPIEGEFTEKK